MFDFILHPFSSVFPCSHPFPKQHPNIYLLRNLFPNGLSLRKGLLGSTINAFPGIMPSTSPYIMAVKVSVVGSGPTLPPGKSCSSRYLNQQRSNHGVTSYFYWKWNWITETQKEQLVCKFYAFCHTEQQRFLCLKCDYNSVLSPNKGCFSGGVLANQ